MASDSEQSTAPNGTLHDYFASPLSEPGSFVAKATRNRATRKAVGPEYISKKSASQAKTSSQATASQESVMPPSAKRRKPDELSVHTASALENLNDEKNDWPLERNSEVEEVEINEETETSSQVSSATLNSSVKKSPVSWLHSHFTLERDPINQKKRWKCNRCRQTYSFGSGTTSQRKHLSKEHRIHLTDRNEANQGVLNDRIAEALARQPGLDEERKKRQLTELLTSSIDSKTLMFLFAAWIIKYDIAFAQIANDDFRAIIQYLNAPANKIFPRSDTTLRSRIVDFYNEDTTRLRLLLPKAVTDIHITCDAWSSPNHLGMLTVVAHFADENMKQQTILLALKELVGSHTGENQAEVILQVLDDYNIRSKLGYFVMDNVESNDTMLRHISRIFKQEHGIDYDPIEHRLRCMGHVINLAVQAYLFGKHPDVEHRTILDTLPAKELNDRLTEYRKLGPQGKLHNINKFIMYSPQRIQRFKSLSNGLMPKRDMVVRWNSWYIMIDWALRKLKSAMQQYMANEKELDDDLLTASD